MTSQSSWGRRGHGTGAPTNTQSLGHENDDAVQDTMTSKQTMSFSLGFQASFPP